jgi:hypothetical protein
MHFVTVKIGRRKMGISYTDKAMEEIICYWMEAVQVTKRVDELSEYTTEAAKIYAAADSIMSDAESRLKAAIKAAILSESGIFAKYKSTDYPDNMEELTERLYEQLDDIYGFSRQEQINNFYKVLCSCMDDLLLKTA